MKQPSWEHRTRFAIQDKMHNVVKLSLEAAYAERAALLRKLKKMQYGS